MSDAAFAMALRMPPEILAKLSACIDRAISEGLSFEEFAARFRRIVETGNQRRENDVR